MLKSIKKYSIILLISAFLLGFFVCGVILIFKVWPFQNLRHSVYLVKNIINLKDKNEANCDPMCQELFTDDLIDGDLKYAETDSLVDLKVALDRLIAPMIDIRGISRKIIFESAAISPLKKSDASILNLKYRVKDGFYDAYAYVKIKPKSECGVLMIPGTGHNHSYAIIKNSSNNYHRGMLNSFEECSIFALIKPNEDYLSIHKNGKKLTENAYLNHLIGQGSSYGSRYVSDAVAIMQWIKSNFEMSVVTGLSQGGIAATLVALEVNPTHAIIASGPIKFVGEIGYMGYNSLLFPGIQLEVLGPSMYAAVKKSSTAFLFTMGRHEFGVMAMDLKELSTFNLLRDARNVTCKLHSGGHEYPAELIEIWIKESNTNFESYKSTDSIC